MGHFKKVEVFGPQNGSSAEDYPEQSAIEDSVGHAVDFVKNISRDDASEMVVTAKSWIAENRSLAMVGAFATGVFFGVLLRR